MKLQILSNCRAAGRHFSIGEVAELPDNVADELLALRLAQLAPAEEIAPAPEAKPRRSKVQPITTTED
jgi:hypothetical protein